jgi:prepilin-type processing-associated H-X9-DG protein
MWSVEHEGRFPWQVSSTNGGTLEFATSGVAVSYQAASNYLQAQVTRLVCPSDKTKRPATNFATLTEQNVSYFLDLDSVMHSTNSILSGDRHLQLNGIPVKPGLHTVTTNTSIAWTKELHYSGKMIGGNLAYADGHVQYTRESLQRVIRQQPQVTNRFLVP